MQSRGHQVSSTQDWKRERFSFVGSFSIIKGTAILFEKFSSYIYISTYSYSVRSFESKGKGYLSKIRHACKLACGSFVEIRGWGKTVLSLLSRSSFRVQIKTWKEVNQYHAWKQIIWRQYIYLVCRLIEYVCYPGYLVWGNLVLSCFCERVHVVTRKKWTFTKNLNCFPPNSSLSPLIWDPW